jgi:DNA repair exonuclease SbcCD ATPase subunit
VLRLKVRCVLLWPTRTKHRTGDADDEDYHQWGSVLDKDHILYRAYEKLNVDHKKCGPELRVITTKLDTVTAAHRDCSRDIESLTAQLKKHNACAGEIESLNTRLKEHNACAGEIESLNTRLKEHDACAGEIESLTTRLKEHDACAGKLKAARDKHNDCAKAMADLKSELEQLASPEQHAHEGLPGASENESRIATPAQALAKVDSDLRYVIDFIARIFEEHVHRKDANIQGKYRNLAAKLRSWGREDIKQNTKDPSRNATFIDFLREVVVSFDKSVKLHHETFKSVDTATADVQQLDKDIEALRDERDQWRNHCMDVLDKAQLAHGAYQAKENGYIQRQTAMKAIIVELQGLLEDCNVPATT